MEQLLFWLWGGIAVIFAVMMILKRNPVHSALCLVVVFVSLALLYVLLGAEFLAAVQVIVYAGAIMVLFLFVIMLLNLDAEVRSQGGIQSLQPGRHRAAAPAASGRRGSEGAARNGAGAGIRRAGQYPGSSGTTVHQIPAAL
jgi:NADH-quinone oxidoreductase subunit J